MRDLKPILQKATWVKTRDFDTNGTYRVRIQGKTPAGKNVDKDMVGIFRDNGAWWKSLPNTAKRGMRFLRLGKNRADAAVFLLWRGGLTVTQQKPHSINQGNYEILSWDYTKVQPEGGWDESGARNARCDCRG